MVIRFHLVCTLAATLAALSPPARGAAEAFPSPEGYAHPEMLAEPAWLSEHLADASVRIVDMRDEKAYAAGHIPNAVRMDESPLRNPEDRLTYLPGPEALAAMMNRAGIGNNTRVIVYDDQGGKMAARLWYILSAFGHKDVRLLNGGWRKWTAENRPVSTEKPVVSPTRFTARSTPSMTCPLPQLLKRERGVVVLDARSVDEYEGRMVSTGAKQAGRIPGAVNIEWKENVTGPNLEFKHADELRRLYAAKGITADREIVTHCASGGRAAQTLFTLKLLGYPKVRIYYGSFGDYSTLENVPIERPSGQWELRKGEFYYRVEGIPTFVMGRNPTETSVDAFDSAFRSASTAGEKLIRVHLMHGLPPHGPPGQVEEAWARQWDRVFDSASRHHLGVIPVFTIWAQWNDGSRGEFWHVWQDNPYNAARGGPARSPADLFTDSECRRLWLEWLTALVKRWQARDCIVAWEPISEIDLVTGSNPKTAAQFVEQAAQRIREADPKRRPVTVSLSGIVDWPEVNRSPGVDIVQTHPYADPGFNGNLSDLILDSVRERLRRYGKPVLIGECGLDARPPANTLTLAERAIVGIRHALWASVVSGAMNGRMLWWEDGYDKYERADIAGRYQEAAVPMAQFVRGVSFQGLKPIELAASKEVKGAALAGDRLIVGWVRDAQCSPPAWPIRRLTGENVTFMAAGPSRRWSVQFYNTQTGKPEGKAIPVAGGGQLRIVLPAFHESIVFMARSR